MQFLEGGAGGPNGRESRTVRSSDHDLDDPEPAAGRGSLMARYRGTPQPAAAEDEATPPTGTGDEPPDPLPAPGARPPAGAPEDSPWRRSNWTSAPRPPAHSAPTPPATTRPPTAPTPPVTNQPVTTQPPPGPPPSTQPATTRQPTGQPPASPPPAAPSSSAPAFETPADTAADEPADKLADKPADKLADKDPTALERPAGRPADIARPAPTVKPADTPAPAPSTAADGLLGAAESAEFRRRWRDLQADFVDDPQRAVRGAGDLSREILRALVGTIADAERVDRWKAQDGTSGTEDLRVALRQYRTLVDRLLEL